MMALLKHVVTSNNWIDRVDMDVLDGVSPHYANESFDASISNFGIFFPPILLWVHMKYIVP
jgi:hypothetical protein